MTDAPDTDRIEKRLAGMIGKRLAERFDATPLVDMTALTPPPSHR